MGHRSRFLLLFSVFLATGAAAAPPEAQVGVYAEHRNGNVVYHYEVTNRSAQALRGFRLGCDCALAPEAGQLTVLPAGARPERPDARGTGYTLPPDAVTAPAGWRARVRRPGVATGYWIEWYTPDPRPDAGIAPGATLEGFSVALPRPDAAFLEGEVTFAAAPAQRLRLLDLQPPQLSLRAQSASRGREAASFRIIVSASDNRDPDPRVTLESFEPARPAPGAGPAWIVTYTAVDASGIRTTASTRLARPWPGAGPDADTERQEDAVPDLNLLRLAEMPARGADLCRAERVGRSRASLRSAAFVRPCTAKKAMDGLFQHRAKLRSPERPPVPATPDREAHEARNPSRVQRDHRQLRLRQQLHDPLDGRP